MDIFLLIGQSNMAGRGHLDQVPPITHPRIRMFRDNAWQTAVEPLHRDKASAGVGLAMSFALSMIERYPSLDIGLIPTAVGGTPLSRWQPEGDLYQNALAQAKAAISKADTFRGFLWHQGEADANRLPDASTYGQRLQRTIAGFRKDLNAPAAPFIAGELGEFLIRKPNLVEYKLVNQQMHLLETMVTNYAVVSAAGLADNGDNLHFNAASLRTFGERYAEEFCRLM